MTQEYLLLNSEDLPYVMEGAGAVVKRVVGPSSPVPNVGPLILLDHADIPPGVGFPMHPHSGFEILTYILKGELRHRDSEGFEAAVEVGGMQHLFTGRGMWHEEMPGDQGAEVLQIWISLPAEARSLPPAYRSIPSEEVPEGGDGPMAWRSLAGPNAPVTFRRPVAIRDMKARGRAEVGSAGGEGSLALYAMEGASKVSLPSDSLELAPGGFLVMERPGRLTVEPVGEAFRFALFSLPSEG